MREARLSLRKSEAKVADLVLADPARILECSLAELAALAGRFPGRPLVAVFEPRSNTSRRAVFQREYAEAFGAAARVVVQIVPDAPIYSAFGGDPERLSAERLAHDIAARGVPALALPDVDAIVAHLAKSCAPGDVVVTLSNGGFDGIWEKLLARLRG